MGRQLGAEHVPGPRELEPQGQPGVPDWVPGARALDASSTLDPAAAATCKLHVFCMFDAALHLPENRPPTRRYADTRRAPPVRSAARLSGAGMTSGTMEDELPAFAGKQLSRSFGAESDGWKETETWTIIFNVDGTFAYKYRSCLAQVPSQNDVAMVEAPPETHSEDQIGHWTWDAEHQEVALIGESFGWKSRYTMRKLQEFTWE